MKRSLAKLKLYSLPILFSISILVTTSTLSCPLEGRQNSKEDNTVAYLNEPGLIDVHAHIGEFKGYDLSLNNLLINIAENHIQYAFISNIDGAAIPDVTANGDEVAINEETARASAAHPELKPLVWS